MTRVLLLADTHLGVGQASRLIERLGEHLSHADAIIHAGDITDGSVLDELARCAPVHAVRGNNDVRGSVRLLPERSLLDIDGCAVAVIHDSGQAAGRARRLRTWFPTADAVVFGHSHIPWHERDVISRNGTGVDHIQHHINPGSAIQARRQPRCTAAWLTIDAGAIVDVVHVPLT
jgi:putative phosphoesterase